MGLRRYRPWIIPLHGETPLKRYADCPAGLCSGGIAATPFTDTTLASSGQKTDKFVIEGIGAEPGYSVKELMKKLLGAVGGLSRFISRGDVVVIKPNLSWARKPRMAAGESRSRKNQILIGF